MSKDVTILDTTLRDGSYVVDFGFTEHDTESLSRALDRLGFSVIEIGHGVGINATVKVAPAAASDVAYVKAARRGVAKAKIAMFCVPGVAGVDDMNACIDAGLQVVRVGTNITAYGGMAPFLESARKRGATAYANLMKSYLLPASAFAEVARDCEAMGAEGVFVVDSAGGMMPEDVSACIGAMRSATTLPLGFHGHNNLGLVVANCLAAVDAGATFVDTTLMGMGRSSGNPPTELMVALLQRRYGACTDIDAELVMELAEVAVGGIVRGVPSEGPIVNALGLAQVHSSYLPKIAAAAAGAGKQLFDTVFNIGRRDRCNLPPAVLESAVAEARKARGLGDLAVAAPQPGDRIFR